MKPNDTKDFLKLQIEIQKAVCYRELQKLSDFKKQLRTMKDKYKVVLPVPEAKYKHIIDLCLSSYDLTMNDLFSQSRKLPIPDCVKLIAILTYDKGLNISRMAEYIFRNHSTIHVAYNTAKEFISDSFYQHKVFKKKYDEIKNMLK